MRRSLSTSIVRDLTHNVPFYRHDADTTGKLGVFRLMKATSAIRQLAYDTVPDAPGEYLQMADKTSCDYLDAFCKGL